MNKKIGLIIGTLLFFSAIEGFAIYNDYVIKESKTGQIIENTIEAPALDDVLTPPKSK